MNEPAQRANPPAAHRSLPATNRSRTLAVLIVIGAMLAGLALTAVLGPHRYTLDDTRSGDPQLAEFVATLLEDSQSVSGISVTTIQPQGAVSAGLGAAAPGAETPIELGSITKTFTGSLLAIAVDKNEVRLSDPVGDYLPKLQGTATGQLTLEQLATHRAGLPSVLPSELLTGVIASTLRGDVDPYRGYTTARVIEEAGALEPAQNPEYEYSNLGIALLGHAVAEAAGADSWAALAQARIFEPVGMKSTVIASNLDALPTDRAIGHTSNGFVAAPWLSEGFAPAGTSTWTTATDMTRYAQAILNGTVPGPQALTPIADAGAPSRIGLAWTTIVDPELPRLLYHNGGTAGFRTNLTVDLEANRAVFVVGDSEREMQNVGFHLVSDQWPEGSFSAGSGPPIVGLALLLVVAAQAIGTVLSLTKRQKSSAGEGQHSAARTDRVSILTALLLLAPLGYFLVRAGPWGLLPGLAAGAVLGVAAAATVLTALRWQQWPWWKPGVWHRINAGFTAALTLGVVALTLAGLGLSAG